MAITLSEVGQKPVPTCISLGILAWNEEEAIASALASLFRQSLFAQLSERHLQCEIVCIANGCTDQTAAVAAEIFQDQSRVHLFKAGFSCRSLNLPERGKTNAWNLFVHAVSSRQAPILFLMDGDIMLHRPDTLWNMYSALLDHPEASIATDQPIKDIALLRHPSLRERLSLATSRMTRQGTAQVTGQLYAIRAAVARNIYLPRDLVACEDGFIKALACTSFATAESVPERVITAPNASHIFEAYTKPGDLLRNQKRQMIGQTIVHLLFDGRLKELPAEDKLHLAETLRRWDETEPDWLKRLIAAHLRQGRFFWRLFPGLLTFRFQRLAKVKFSKRILYLPATIIGFLVSLLAGFLAWRFLRLGSTEYWPDTRSRHLKKLEAHGDLVTRHT